MTGVAPEFTILLARQRTGTNALRSVLDTHRDICCFDEVFKLEDRQSPDPRVRASNYFTFLERHCAGDITRAFPDRHAELFTAFLAHLRTLTAKRHIVIDVKYNSTHHITGEWRSLGSPTLFDLIRSHGVGVIQLTRHNLLRCLLSTIKGRTTGRYYVRDNAAPPPDLRVTVPIDAALATMEHWAFEDDVVAGSFADWPRYTRLEYSELFPDRSGAMSAQALAGLARWFGVEPAFTNRVTLSKQSSLPLASTIANFDEVRAALQDTRFAWFLDDEPAYRQPAAGVVAGPAAAPGPTPIAAAR